MKRLVLFCDGTWNDLRMPALTNVARLAKCVLPEDAARVQQIVFYDAGVGVAAGVSRTIDWLTRIQGGAFGRGLDEKIENAYRFLVLNYEVGDEIFIFGFSRGAYTARSLCGLIRKCGIVRRNCFDVIPRAVDIYRNGQHPADVKSFRDTYAHRHTVLGEKDGPTLATGLEDLPEEQRPLWGRRYPMEREGETPRVIYKTRYLGLWDTVGSLGVPTRFPWLAGLNERYRFHDTDASALLTSVRQAAAVDEDRRVFDLTPVSNIHKLNVEWALNTGRDLDAVPYDLRPYQQRWFPGGHGAVGGGNLEPGLSSAALLWIAEGAERAGLGLDRSQGGELSEAARLENPLAEWRIDRQGRPTGTGRFDLFGFVGGYADRRPGPLTEPEVHESTWERVDTMPTYRPRPLQRFTGEVERPPPYRRRAHLAFMAARLGAAAGAAAALAAAAWSAGLIPTALW